MSNTSKARWDVGQRVMPEALRAFCINAMTSAGMREEQARTTAEVLVTTDTWGVYTHGTKQLRPLLRHMREGGLDPNASPEVISETATSALIDGHYAMPPVTSCFAMR